MAEPKPIISLTSWRKRINTVGKTIYSIITNCKFYEKIVLVLSTDEFPEKEACLPEDLKIMHQANLFEILWVKENVKCFKKVLFTLKQYPQNPVVSADDDCLYNCDYVSVLYAKWKQYPTSICSYRTLRSSGISFQHGPAALYPPGCFGDEGLKHLTANVLSTWHDDVYYGILANKLKIQIVDAGRNVPYKFHNTDGALSKTLTKSLLGSIQIIKRELGER